MKRVLLSSLLAAAVALSATAATRYPISAESVAAAISDAGMQVTPNQVSLLTGVVATTDAPELRVTSIEPRGDRRDVIRLECAQQQCLPFFVTVSLRPQHAASTAPVARAEREQPPPPKPLTNPVMVHRGARVTLLLTGSHVQITIPVTCMENGMVGQSIRANDETHHLVYTAMVVNQNLLRSAF